METRLGLDTVTVTFEFDPHDERDREQISELYRFGRILRHVASETERHRGSRAARNASSSVSERRHAMSRRSHPPSVRERQTGLAVARLGLGASAGGSRSRRSAARSLAGCAKKPATAPAPAGAPRFADFVFPAAAAGPGAAPRSCDQHRAAWQMLQAGDTKSAERDFTAVLKQAPDFYPAEAGLGYAALARKDAPGRAGAFRQGAGAKRDLRAGARRQRGVAAVARTHRRGGRCLPGGARCRSRS